MWVCGKPCVVHPRRVWHGWPLPWSRSLLARTRHTSRQIAIESRQSFNEDLSFGPGSPASRTSSARHSALLGRLRHEATELRYDLVALALRALHAALLALGDRHDELERLLALFAQELVARHGVDPFSQRRAGTVSSSSVDAKDLIPSANRSLHLHRRHAAAWSFRHRLMLDLE
jgi:hypothetical protein